MPEFQVVSEVHGVEGDGGVHGAPAGDERVEIVQEPVLVRHRFQASKQFRREEGVFLIRAPRHRSVHGVHVDHHSPI